MSENIAQAPRWMKVVLVLAGIYNLTWGALVIYFPRFMFHYSGLEQAERTLNYPEVWQCVGMVVGVYGVGYLLASRDPLRHWPIVLVGLLGKLFGPIGTTLGALRGELPWAAVGVNLFNDFPWWLPFGLILHRAYRTFIAEGNAPPSVGLEAVLDAAHDQHGRSVLELSRTGPVLLIFLRHFG